MNSKSWKKSENLIQDYTFTFFGLEGSNIGVRALFETFQLGTLIGVGLDSPDNSSRRLGRK